MNTSAGLAGAIGGKRMKGKKKESMKQEMAERMATMPKRGMAGSKPKMPFGKKKK